ncbi:MULTISPECIES: TIGR01244 family sulfur transferase [Vibrio]|uniref:TIGR01244 family sulfur transferase n=2 Tax=Bacteria TaxID=2 RepID=UPI0012AE9BAF|nr:MULTISPECIES: TIGR01244 family sulfur transferase [unclassified Vibrio]EKO3574727.1 TIGR01244 family phosphatase [Vibrio metschnikovii]EKO3598133.1 TIGR01244 family phosphatase [Vibrio metschnikovii]EKO3627066.1 TIGR01244 family phosphatase [Vibrio metschnikovii]EKO3630196.1 TIGR01244 family phosphatase [Vibrio metschnikovii]EKO3658168.1 TIGR01244 family phosphatase [Vibrio metschnikovii]
MLTLITLTPQLTVAPQIEPSDIEQIAGLGFKSVINNRPDGEESGQPLNQVIEQHADQLGLVYVHLPVVGGQISEAQIHQFGELLQTLPQPILAFCRTGTRSSMLWSLASQDSAMFSERLQVATKQGFKLDGLGERFAQR